MSSNEYDDWVKSLYDETYSVEYSGRKFIFKCEYPNSLNDKIKNLDVMSQNRYLLEYTSVEPKLTTKQMLDMPDTLMAVLMAAMLNQKMKVKKLIESILPDEIEKKNEKYGH